MSYKRTVYRNTCFRNCALRPEIDRYGFGYPCNIKKCNKRISVDEYGIDRNKQCASNEVFTGGDY